MTFSIVARDAGTGQLGCAIASAVPAVGSVCVHIEPQVGAIATQSWVNPYLGIDGLAALRAGADAPSVIDTLLQQDPDREKRQVGIVDAHGASATFTGQECTGWAGSSAGSSFSVQGNMLAGAATLESMVEAFLSSASLDLSERLLLALAAGDRAGGDKRGRQSAALKVHAEEEYPLVDLRVDEHGAAVSELARVHGIASRQALPYTLMMPTRANPRGSRDLATESMLLQSPRERHQ